MWSISSSAANGGFQRECVRTGTHVEPLRTGSAMSTADPFIYRIDERHGWLCRKTRVTHRRHRPQPMSDREKRRQFVGSGEG